MSLNGVRFAPCNCLTNDEYEDVLFMFVTGNEDNEYTSASKYAVILDTDAAEEKNGDDTVYTYDVVIDGEETTLSFKKDNAPKFELEKGLVFAYAMDGDYATVKDVTAPTTAQAKTATKDYFTDANDTQYNLSDAKALYTINVEYKKDGTTIDSVYVTTGVDIDAGDKVVYTLDGDDLDVLFVYDDIK